jgi:hypothetical protein
VKLPCLATRAKAATGASKSGSMSGTFGAGGWFIVKLSLIINEF